MKKKKKKFRGDMVLFFSLAIEIAIVLWVFEKRNKIIQSGYSISAGGNQIFFLLCCIVPIFFSSFYFECIIFSKKEKSCAFWHICRAFFYWFYNFLFDQSGDNKETKSTRTSTGHRKYPDHSTGASDIKKESKCIFSGYRNLDKSRL